LKQLRQVQRFPFHWEVAIVFDEREGKKTFHGTTHDISVMGCAILTEHNVFSEYPITVVIALPATNPGGQKTMVQAKGRMIYTVHSSGHRKFRSGIEFSSFANQSLEHLQHALESRSRMVAPIET
jgi:hypothetical protein